MDSENEKITTAKIVRHLLKIDIMLIIAFILIGVAGVRGIINTTKQTKALSEVAQKVGVDFPTKTNNVFGLWQIIKPQ